MELRRIRKTVIVYSIALVSLSLVFGADLFGQEVYTIQDKTLKEALETISEKSNLPYIANDELLVSEKKVTIENIEGLENALQKLLQGTELKAIIKDNAIVIVKDKNRMAGKKDLSSRETTLDKVVVMGKNSEGSAEAGYLVANISGLGIWKSRSLQDTPYQMTAASSDLLENSIGNDFNDLFRKMPNIQENQNWRAPTLRGFSSTNPILEGLKTSYALAVDPVETERVEILNGASGFMYGSGNVGGAVNYIIKKSTDKPIKNVTLGNYGGSDYYAHLDVGGKIDDKGKLGYRINALYEDGETSVENQSKNHKLIGATFDYDISDKATVILNLMHRERENQGRAYFYFTGAGVDSRPSSAYDSSKLYAIDNPNEYESDRAVVKLNWKINDIFSTRLAYHYLKEDRLFDITMNTLQADGTFINSLWSSRFDYVGYGTHAYLDAEFDTGSISHVLTLGVSQSIGEFNKYKSNKAIFQRTTGLSLSDLEDLGYFDAQKSSGKLLSSEIKDTSILIGDDITFSKQWSALLGLNYITVGTITYNSDGSVKTDYEKSAVTPNLSLIYKPSDFSKFTTYISYIEALEQGTIVSDIYANAGDLLDPLISKQYELGAKYSLNENLLISSALFKIENANQFSDGKVTPTYVQDGLEIHQGIELSAAGKATENLTVMGGVTIMDLSIEEANDPDLEGKEPTNAATKLAKIFAEYDIPSIEGLMITGGASHTGKRYGDSDNTDVIPAYTLFDFGARYRTIIDKYPTAFNINIANITDEDYWVSTNTLGDPRNIAFSMKMEF